MSLIRGQGKQRSVLALSKLFEATIGSIKKRVNDTLPKGPLCK
ncbi:hypothetical protein THOG05_60017 [Vibrio rotiferianus]|nr:hypothetical protein THOG05_60017 [Vibrio rotiferianus]